MADHKQDERERFQAALFGEEERKLIELARSALTGQDRTELEQYRAIFAKLNALILREGEVHVAREFGTNLVIVRMVDFDGKNEFQVTKPGEHPTGATLRDALAQAAQVVS